MQCHIQLAFVRRIRRAKTGNVVFATQKVKRNIVRSGRLHNRKNMNQSENIGVCRHLNIALIAERSCLVESERITKEQAVEVAEFFKVKPIFRHWKVNGEGYYLIRNHKEISLVEWLYSPEGQSAVMDRLGELGVYVEIPPPNKYVGEKFRNEITLKELHPQGGHCWLRSGHGSTRQYALLLAVLEMLKGGE